jgi:hypothetical protein
MRGAHKPLAGLAPSGLNPLTLHLDIQWATEVGIRGSRIFSGQNELASIGADRENQVNLRLTSRTGSFNNLTVTLWLSPTAYAEAPHLFHQCRAF